MGQRTKKTETKTRSFDRICVPVKIDQNAIEIFKSFDSLSCLSISKRLSSKFISTQAQCSSYRLFISSYVHNALLAFSSALPLKLTYFISRVTRVDLCGALQLLLITRMPPKHISLSFCFMAIEVSLGLD